MYRYSIIVPVCNIQAGHLTQCLNSVKQQSYGEYECILVKDAKTDPNVVEFVEK
jgi:glycosyltransferase involved in cell wall biosynthesis